jgi:ribosomal-protein-serine acetyltransferase
VTAAPADFVLRDGELELRRLEREDAGELRALIDRNRAELARWLQWAHNEDPEQPLRFILDAHTREAQETAMQRAILCGGRIAGTAGLTRIDWMNLSAEIGYWLDAAHQGQGIMTAAVRALAGHAFERLGLNRLEIRTDVENGASRAVAERLGFRYEGTLRQAYRIAGDRYSDDAVYSLLAAEHSGGARLGGAGR